MSASDRIEEFGRELGFEIQDYQPNEWKRWRQRFAGTGDCRIDTVGVNAIVSAYDDEAIARIRKVVA